MPNKLAPILIVGKWKASVTIRKIFQLLDKRYKDSIEIRLSHSMAVEFVRSSQYLHAVVIVTVNPDTEALLRHIFIKECRQKEGGAPTKILAIRPGRGETEFPGFNRFKVIWLPSDYQWNDFARQIPNPFM